MPQLLLSVWSARQVALAPEPHEVCPDGHAQLPATQAVPPVQVRAQAPQLVLSVCRSRQVPEHTVCPAEQVVVQAPARQIWPPGQTLPQAPQWLVSVEVSRQVPEQLVWPPPHDTVQTPAEQTWPPGQMTPQAPQLLLSPLRLTSQPLLATRSQSPKPMLQVVTVHAPAAQPGVPLITVHARPQAPQWATVVLVLVSQPLVTLPSQLPSPRCRRCCRRRRCARSAVPC